MQDLVEADYVNGRPRHHLACSRNPNLEDGASIFFIVEHVDFAKMSARQIQDIARHRHIVVRNIPQPKYEWNSETLSEFGDLRLPREIQSKYDSITSNTHYADPDFKVGEHRQDAEVPNMLKIGTLQNMLDTADERVLVCLDLPTSSSEIVRTPGLK